MEGEQHKEKESASCCWGTWALENQVHVSVNETVITKNKVSNVKANQRPACNTVGTQSCFLASSFCSLICSNSLSAPPLFLLPLFIDLFLSFLHFYPKLWKLRDGFIAPIFVFLFFFSLNALAVASKGRVLHQLLCSVAANQSH